MITRKQAILRDVVDALDAVHVARGDRMDRGQVARVPLGLEPRAERCEHHIRAAQRQTTRTP
jgi:hypothetical protein